MKRTDSSCDGAQLQKINAYTLDAIVEILTSNSLTAFKVIHLQSQPFPFITRYV